MQDNLQGNAAPQPRRLLSISTDRLIFEEGSAVRTRILGYAKDWDEMHIVVATDRSFNETSIAPNVWVYPTRSKMKALYPFDAVRLGRFIIERRGITDITCQDPFLTAFAGISLKKQSGLPLEIQVHTDVGSPNFGFTLANRIRKSLAVSYLPKADSIRVVSERIKTFLVGSLGIAPQKITVRPIAVDMSGISAAPITVDLHKKYPQFEKIVLMASRFEPEKNIQLAIKAWKDVIEEIPKAGLVIVGKGSQEMRLKKSVSGMGLNDSVVFEPWGAKGNLHSFYKTADLFLSTSLFEGYGMTFVEAKAAGCPIVSTDVGVAKEMGAKIIEWDAADAARGITEALGV